MTKSIFFPLNQFVSSLSFSFVNIEWAKTRDCKTMNPQSENEAQGEQKKGRRRGKCLSLESFRHFCTAPPLMILANRRPEICTFTYTKGTCKYTFHNFRVGASLSKPHCKLFKFTSSVLLFANISPSELTREIAIKLWWYFAQLHLARMCLLSR